MDRYTLAKTKKFDISCMIAEEKLAFTKMKLIFEQESHGVNLGVGYTNNHACATFVCFIAKYIKKKFTQFPIIKKKNQFFFSLQANASIDAGNVELSAIFNNLL